MTSGFPDDLDVSFTYINDKGHPGVPDPPFIYLILDDKGYSGAPDPSFRA